jgi:hypothetical protein
MNFRASLCDPLKPEIIELGDIEKDKIIDEFEKIPWRDLLRKMDEVEEKEIFYSPSFEIENKDNKNGLVFSIIDETEWYIFFKRPKLVQKRRWVKKIEYMDEDYLSDITGQTIHDIYDCIRALLRNDLDYLEEKMS